MGYMNPVLQYGFEKFCADAAAAGIDGLILPDLPEYEFETEVSLLLITIISHFFKFQLVFDIGLTVATNERKN